MPQPEQSQNQIVSVSPPDGHAVDAVLSARSGDSQADAVGQDARVAKVEHLMSLLDHHPATEPPSDLAQRTMDAILQAKQRQQFTQQISTLSQGPSLGFGWYELGALAASLLIFAALAVPMLSKSQGNARRLACANQMQTTAGAMLGYAADYQGIVPRGPVGKDAVWFRTGAGPDAKGAFQSNSSHLYLLIRRGYVKPRLLSCPDNARAPQNPSRDARDWRSHDELSYSYQNQFTANPLRLDQWPGMPILADRNPLFLVLQNRSLVMRSGIDLKSVNSVLHGMAGQNILTGDGVVQWRDRPVMPNGDNIWTIKRMRTYKGNEVPDQPDDAFLVQ